MKLAAIALLAFTPFVGAMNAPTPPDKKTDSYFPINVGAKWVYQWSSKEEEIRKVTAVEEREGAKLVTVSEEGKDGKLTKVEVVSVSENGVRLLYHFGAELNPPVWLLKTPCKRGDTWNCKTNWFRCSSLDATATIIGLEDMEVPAGKFNTICVERRYALNGTTGGYKWTDWMAVGVGRVKMVDYFDGSIVIAKLKSFTPGE